jgi:hypothetical protein
MTTARGSHRWTRRGTLVLAATALAGCASGTGGLSGPPPTHSGPAVTYVALGEQVPSTVTDPRLFWQLMFEKSALPYWATTFVVTVPEDWESDPAAVAGQVTAFSPTVVSVDVGPEEALAGDGVAGFAASLDQLLDALDRAHVPTILVADLPPAPQQSGTLPTAAEVAEYDSAIAADCKAAGAVRVDVHGILARASSAGQAVSSASMLTALGDKLVAAAFEAAVRNRPLSRPARGRPT